MNGVGTGSGRSIPGVDLGRAVRRAAEQGILVKGGGHPMAAGITIDKAALGRFRAFMDEQLGDAIQEARRDDALLIDGALSAAGATAEMVATIARAGPFGAGNAEPVFVLPSHSVIYAEPVGGDHIRARLKGHDGAVVSAIAFRARGRKLGEALLESRGQQLHAAGTLCLDRWQGAERVQLQLTDIAADTSVRA
jgi:single-stranded-DNA-specific exonuclease